MKLTDILLLGISLAFLIIGVDQAITLGFSKAYWAFMLALVTFFAFTMRKIGKPPQEDEKTNKAGRGRKRNI